jgi:DTW domain-containing protein YfiP
LCGLYAPFTAHCELLILQHPNEHRKYYSTVKLVTQLLTNARVVRGVVFQEGEIESALSKIGAPPQQTYLLYPGKDSTDCQKVHLDRTSTVIVIDGTWDEAGKIVYRNPILQSFPKISFSQSLESNYKVRKQPRPGYLSTLESIAHLLQINAQTTGQGMKAQEYAALFELFQIMVDRQLSYFPRMRKAALVP